MARPETAVNAAERHGRIFTGCARHWALGALLASVMAAPGVVQTGRTEAQPASPEDVEAAYLYNFGKFVRWPEDRRHGPLLFCVAGQRSFAQILTRLVSDENIDGRPLDVRLLSRRESPLDCSILFISAADRGQMEDLLRRVAGRSVLTVSDIPDFLAHGGIIQFLPMQSHVRFSVNLASAIRNELDLSSELLKVAASVTGKPSGGGAR